MILSNATFLQQPEFKFRPKYVKIFIVAAIAAWGLNFLGQTAFPTSNTVPYFIRTTLTLIIVLGMTRLTFYSLKQNGLSPNTLGLKISLQAFSKLALGAAIGLITILLLIIGLEMVVPFRMTIGNLHGLMLLKECYWYLLNNALEEIMFRGFLLIILIQLTDWRRAALIMALPFGLFHLPALGLTLAGLKMVMTTMTVSFVFSYAFVLTGSLFTAIGAHVTMNILVHAFLGLDGAGKAMYLPVFSTKWPTTYDPAFIITLIGGLLVAGLLFLLINYRTGVQNRLNK